VIGKMRHSRPGASSDRMREPWLRSRNIIASGISNPPPSLRAMRNETRKIRQGEEAIALRSEASASSLHYDFRLGTTACCCRGGAQGPVAESERQAVGHACRGSSARLGSFEGVIPEG